MSRYRVAGFFRFIVVALVASIALTGCRSSAGKPTTHSSSVPKPPLGLTEALDRLATAPAIRYRAPSLAGAPDTAIDYQVTRNGLTVGTMTARGQRVKVLVVDGKTYAHGPVAFWQSSGTETSRAKIFAKKWVEIAPQSVLDPQGTLRPSQVASALRRAFAGKSVRSEPATVNGIAASRIAYGGDEAFITATRPYRVIAYRLAQAAGDRGRTAAPTPAPTLSTTIKQAAWSLPIRGAGPGDDDPVEVDGLGDDAVDSLYDQLGTQSSQLKDALDAQVNFSLTGSGNLACPPVGSGICTATHTVSNTATSGGDATVTDGVVRAVMQVTMNAGALGMRNCSDSKVMPPNSSTVMSCSAFFSVPRGRTPRTYPIQATFVITAQAMLKVSKIIKDLRDDFAAERRNRFTHFDPDLTGSNLPRFGQNGDRTTYGNGVDSNGRPYSVQSGNKAQDIDLINKANKRLRDRGVLPGNAKSERAHHAEQKFAMKMHDDKSIDEADLVINNPDGPCPPRLGCDQTLPYLLRPKQKLTVWWPDGNGAWKRKIFEGLP